MFKAKVSRMLDFRAIIVMITVFTGFTVSSSSSTCGAFLEDKLVPVNSGIFTASTASEGPGIPLINSTDVWCAGVVDENQYLTVDLGKPVIACDITVGGKKGTQRSVSQYHVLTSTDGVTFNPVQDNRGKTKGFQGCLLDGDKVSKAKLPQPVECRYIRFNPREPLTRYPNFLCMRVEIHGCLKPVDGGFTNWSSWTSCSKSCDGTQTRSRICTSPSPAHGGADCVGETSQNQRCNVGACASTGDSGFTAWSQWSVCSHTCGRGDRYRTRVCRTSLPLPYGGLPCRGDTWEHEPCNEGKCPNGGGLTEWSNWSACTKTCDGTQERRRSCASLPPSMNGSRPCKGNAYESRDCNIGKCPKVDGGFSPWGDWSLCSKSCGYGTVIRMRTCTNPFPANGGAPCHGPNHQEYECHLANCVVDGGFTAWNNWSPCSRKCDGFQQRTRSCTSPSPSKEGKSCVGMTSQHRNCNTGRCAEVPPTDIAFAISASAVDSDANFQFMKYIINGVVDKWSTYKARYSVLVYGKQVYVRLRFSDTFPNDESLKKYINSTQKPNSSEALYKAITESKRLLEGPASRTGASKVLVVVLDNLSGTTEDELSKVVKPLTDAGIKIIVVRIGNGISYDQAKSIAKNDRNILGLKKDERVIDAADKVMKKIMEAVNNRGYGSWSIWGACSKTCRYIGQPGLQTRMRVCTNQSAGCLGPRTETRVCGDIDCSGCGELGTGNSTLSDRAFQASSEFSPETSAPSGRMNSSSAWCSQPGDDDVFLQIDLGDKVKLYRVATLGKETGEQLWVTRYQLSLSKDGNDWHFYEENGKPKTFNGNSDASTKVSQVINTTETYSHVRFHPVSWNKKLINKPACMRVGIYGCLSQSTVTTGFLAPGRDNNLWVVMWILAGILTVLLLLCMIYLCCCKGWCCATCCAKYCGCCFCGKYCKKKQRKMSKTVKSDTDGIKKVFVPLKDRNERETQEIAVVMGTETAEDLGTIEFEMEKVTQFNERRGSQENLIVSEMPSYFASHEELGKVSKLSSKEDIKINGFKKAKKSGRPVTPPPLPTYDVPCPIQTSYLNKAISEERLVDVAMEIHPTVGETRRASEPAVRTVIDNGYHSESDELLDSGLDPKLLARGLVEHHNEVRSESSVIQPKKHFLDVALETGVKTNLPSSTSSATVFTDAQGLVTGYTSHQRSAQGNLVIKVPIITEEIIDERLVTSPDNKMRGKIWDAQL